jgi:hypothetical protein
MTPEKLAKVKAIAEDARADPFTRSIAQKMLESEGPQLQPRPINPLHPGMRTTPEYERYRRAVRGKAR